jgi:predicted lipoprotein with Yx(FWY)xxD motif
VRIRWADRPLPSWRVAGLSLGAAVVAMACGHSPGTTAATIRAIQPVSALVSGTPETVLEGDLQRSLYYSSTDSPTTVECTSACTHTWLPFLKPVAPLLASPGPSGPNGTFTWRWGADGCQAEYNGHPLYTFAGDTRPAEARGDGLRGTWFVVTPDLSPAAGWTAAGARSTC